MPVLLQDDFNRTNSTTALGSPQVGGPYTISGGTWGINANRAYLSTATNPGTATAPGAFNVEGQYTLGAGTAGSSVPSLVFRYADNNNYWRVNPRSASGEAALQVVRANTAYTLGPLILYDGAAGRVFKFKAYGNRIQVWLDGALGIDVIGMDSDPSATRIGMANNSNGTGYWDDILFSTADPFPGWGANPQGFDGVEVDFDAAALVTPSLYKGRDSAAADESEIP